MGVYNIFLCVPMLSVHSTKNPCKDTGDGLRMDNLVGVCVLVGDGRGNHSRFLDDNAGIFRVRVWTKCDFDAQYCTGVLRDILYQSTLDHAGWISIVFCCRVRIGLDVFRYKTQNATK